MIMRVDDVTHNSAVYRVMSSRVALKLININYAAAVAACVCQYLTSFVNQFAVDFFQWAI